MPAEYNWPQKVRRYQITCPFQRILVAKYEAQIEWNKRRIQSPEALDAHIREVMLPKLQSWISPDHPESHYCKTVNLSRMLANPAPHIQKARRIAEKKGEDAARAFLLTYINKHKKEQFDAWWNYVTEENPLYTRHPAFQYLILRPLLESSTERDTRPPIPLDAEALGLLFERISNAVIDPKHRLLPLICEAMAFGQINNQRGPIFGSECHWTVLTAQCKNAANRVSALSRGSGWCVASAWIAAHYLNQSDFHLLVENGRAVLALRLSHGQAVEVQGRGNSDPGPWWPRTLLYTAARATKIIHRLTNALSATATIQKQLSGALGDIRMLRTILAEQPSKVFLIDAGWVGQLAEAPEEDPRRLVVREAWLACTRGDPFCAALMPEWMAVDKSLQQAIVEALSRAVKSDPRNTPYIPSSLALRPEIQAAIKLGWVNLLSRDPKVWRDVPKTYQANPALIKVVVDGWARAVKSDPKVWCDVPSTYREDPKVIQALRTGWLCTIRNDNFNPRVVLPAELEGDEALVRELKTRWTPFLEDHPRDWHLCPPFLLQDPKMLETLKAGWISLLEKEPALWDQCPDLLLKDPKILAKMWDCRARLLLASPPRRLEHLPKDLAWHFLIVKHPLPYFAAECFEKLAATPSATPVILKLWRNAPDPVLARSVESISALRTSPWHFSQLPQPQQEHPLIREAAVEGWVAWLRLHPSFADLVPASLGDHPALVQVSATLQKAAHEAFVSRCLAIVRAHPNHSDEAIENLGLPRSETEAWRSIRKLRLNYWRKAVKKDWWTWRHMPKSLRKDETALASMREGLGPEIRKNSSLWQTLPPCYREDPCMQRVHRIATRKEDAPTETSPESGPP